MLRFFFLILLEAFVPSNQSFKKEREKERNKESKQASKKQASKSLDTPFQDHRFSQNAFVQRVPSKPDLWHSSGEMPEGMHNKVFAMWLRALAFFNPQVRFLLLYHSCFFYHKKAMKQLNFILIQKQFSRVSTRRSDPEQLWTPPLVLVQGLPKPFSMFLLRGFPTILNSCQMSL